MINTAPVTVVVPCYNAANTLHRTVLSVLAQTVRPKLLILVDDASTDNTGEVLREIELRYPELVCKITLAVNKGPSFARNVGWDLATTEFVAFLDADDEWHPMKLEIMIDWFSKNQQAIFCAHQCIRYLGPLPEINTKKFLVRRFKFHNILISNPFSTPAVMIRTSIGHRFPVSRRYAEDYHLWLMIATEVEYLDRIELPLAWYFKAPYGEAGLSGSLWAMQKGELAVFYELRKKGFLSANKWAAISLFAIAKFLRRCWQAR